MTTMVDTGAYESLLVEDIGAVRRVTINRPEKMNAMDERCQDELVQAVLEAESDWDTRAVLLRGAGRCFSSGYDTSPAKRARRPGSRINQDVESLLATVRRWTAIWNCRIPVVAQVHGYCLAGGADLALHCDLVVVAEDAVIGAPPVRSLGVPPAHMWTYVVGPQWAKRLLLTGDTITGTQAAEIGFALEAVPAGDLEERALGLAQRVALVSRDCLMANKHVVNEALELMGRGRLQQVSAMQDALAHLSPDATAFFALAREQGMKAAVEHRDRPFLGTAPA